MLGHRSVRIIVVALGLAAGALGGFVAMAAPAAALPRANHCDGVISRYNDASSSQRAFDARARVFLENGSSNGYQIYLFWEGKADEAATLRDQLAQQIELEGCYPTP